MQEMIDCLIEEVNRYRGLAQLASEEKFKADYLHKADLLERAAEIVKDTAEIGPHGRLIDAGALFEKVYKAWGTEYDAGESNWFMDMINEAPTIIPANKETSHE